MKYETKIIKGSKLSEVYTEMIENDWQLDYYDKEEVISLWKREIKRTVKPIAGKESPEYLEFIKFYRKEINDKASFANTIPRKYELALEDKDDTGKRITHEYIMNSLRDYKDHLKAFNKPPVGVQVFLNQRRYIEKYQTVKVNYEEKWIYDTMKKREVSEKYQEKIMIEVRLWRKTYEPAREFTSNILESMIEKYWVRKEI